MNANEPTPSDEQLLDWGLTQVLGDESPPDLVANVHAELQGTRAAAPPPMRTPTTLLAAAAVLLGALVVVGVTLWTKSTEPGDSPTSPNDQQPNAIDIPLTPITSLVDANALPVDTRGVEAIGVDDAAIAALTRLRDLEALVIREPWNEPDHGSEPPESAPHVTSACWQHIARFTKLRSLTLSGTSLATRLDGAGGPLVITALERLPLMEQLALRSFDSHDDVLQRLAGLRQLRRLDLSFNDGFTDAGIDALLRCRTLQCLSLRGCHRLYGSSLAKLHELPNLQELDLSTIEPSDPTALALWQHARFTTNGRKVGVNDETLAALAQAPKLRVLTMTNGRWTTDGLRALGASRSLRELDMRGGQVNSHHFVSGLPKALTRLRVGGDFQDAFCHAVRKHLPNLADVDVQACDQISNEGLAALLAVKSLRILNMSQMRGLSADCIDELSKASQLEELDLRGNDFVTRQHIMHLRRTLPALRALRSKHD